MSPKGVNGSASLGSKNYFLEVAKGLLSGEENAQFVGENPNVLNTGFTTVWDGGGSFIWPSGLESWEIASDSVNDTLAGTGARKVRVTGLINDYEPHSEEVEMNGVTPVVLSETNWRSIYGANVTESGSSQYNEGSITLRVTSAGDVRSVIRPTLSRSYSGVFTVPAGKVGFALALSAFAPKGEDYQLRNLARVFGTNTWTALGDIDVYQNEINIDFRSIGVFDEKTDIELTAQSTNSGIRAAAAIQFLLSNKEDTNISEFSMGMM